MSKSRRAPKAPERRVAPAVSRAELLARGEVIAYGIKEAIAYAGIGRTKLYEAIGDGKLPAYSRDGRTLILRDDLMAYVADPCARLPVKPPTKAAQ